MRKHSFCIRVQCESGAKNNKFLISVHAVSPVQLSKRPTRKVQQPQKSSLMIKQWSFEKYVSGYSNKLRFVLWTSQLKGCTGTLWACSWVCLSNVKRHILWAIRHTMCALWFSNGFDLHFVICHYKIICRARLKNITVTHKLWALLSYWGQVLLGNSDSVPPQQDPIVTLPCPWTTASLHVLLRDWWCVSLPTLRY